MMPRMNNTNTKAFQGYAAKMDGKPVFVINSGTLKDGTPGLKVLPTQYIGYAGDHTPVAQYTYRKPIWVKASAVTK